MKRFFVTCISILLFFIIQSSTYRFFALVNISPNFILILVVSLAYMRGRNTGLLVGFFSGLLIDLVFKQIIGVHALLYMVIGYFVGFSNQIYSEDDFTLPIIFIALSDLAYNVLFYLTSFLLKGRLNIGFYLRRIILPELIYTVLVSIFLYKLLNMVNIYLGYEDKGGNFNV